MAPELTRSAPSLKQSQHMFCHRVQRNSMAQLIRHIIRVQLNGGLHTGARFSEKSPIYLGQKRWMLIGSSPEHHTVYPGEMRFRLLQRCNPAIDDDRQVGPALLQPVHEPIIERRNLPVL